MHSRAYLLIKRDLYLLQNSPVDGIDLEPIVDDNIFDLTLFLRPLKSSIWHGCIFRVFCSFNDTFNVQPPMLHFDSFHIPYHPNVDPITGRVSLSTNEKWTSRLTLRLLLEELVSAFQTPNSKTTTNSDAMRMWKYRPNDYQTIIEDAIVKSRELMEIVNEEKSNIPETHPISTKVKEKSRARLRTPPIGARRQYSNVSLNHRISFEDYLNTWKGIATSKSKIQDENPLLHQLSTQPKLQAQHLALNADELARQLDDRALQFERLKYGTLGSDQRGRRTAQDSQTSIPESHRPALVVTEANSRMDMNSHFAMTVHQDSLGEQFMKEDQVEELIEWTQNLPENEENL